MQLPPPTLQGYYITQPYLDMEEVEKRPLIAWCTTEPLFMFMDDTLLSKYTDLVHRSIKLTTEAMRGLTVIVHWSKNCVSLGHCDTLRTPSPKTQWAEKQKIIISRRA